MLLLPAGEEFPAPGCFPFLSLYPERSGSGEEGKLFAKRAMEKEKLFVDGFQCYIGNGRTGEGENRERVKSS